MVRSINVLMTEAESFVGADLNDGTSGNASRATPTILNLARSHFTVTHSFSSFLKLTGASGSSRAISKSFRACTHMDPGVVISSASMSQRIVTSRSVPVILIVVSPTDSINMFERTGMVFFFSTTPWTNPSSFCRFCLLTTNCICLLLQPFHNVAPDSSPTSQEKFYLYLVVAVVPVNL